MEQVSAHPRSVATGAVQCRSQEMALGVAQRRVCGGYQGGPGAPRLGAFTLRSEPPQITSQPRKCGAGPALRYFCRSKTYLVVGLLRCDGLDTPGSVLVFAGIGHPAPEAETCDRAKPGLTVGCCLPRRSPESQSRQWVIRPY